MLNLPNEWVEETHGGPSFRVGQACGTANISAMIRALLIPIAGFALAACALDITDPESRLAGLPDGLDVQLTVEPGEVRQHEHFSAQLTVTNTTTQSIQVVTTHSCLAIPRVIRNGQRTPFWGSWWGCYAAITTHTFAPGETRSHTWDMRAELYSQHPGDVDGAPAPTGTYHIQAEFDTYSDGAQLPKPSLTRTLRVK
jgi:hypothetical protein